MTVLAEVELPERVPLKELNEGEAYIPAQSDNRTIIEKLISGHPAHPYIRGPYNRSEQKYNTLRVKKDGTLQSWTSTMPGDYEVWRVSDVIELLTW